MHTKQIHRYVTKKLVELIAASCHTGRRAVSSSRLGGLKMMADGEKGFFGKMFDNALLNLVSVRI